MGSVFNIDGPVFRVISRLSDLVIVNILWLICSLPIVTIGASTTALYSVCMKMARDEEGKIVKNFFDSFKSNFKQSTGIWLVMMLIILVLGGDFYIVTYMPELIGSMVSYLKGLSLAGFILLFLASEFIFPVLARFENSTKNIIRNALLMELGNVVYLLGVTVINCIILAIYLFYPEGFMNMLFVIILFGASIPAYLNGSLFRKMFEKYEQQDMAADTEN